MDSRKGTADEFRDITYLEPWYTVRAHRSGKLVMAPRTVSDKFGRVFVSIRGRDVPLDYVIASAFIPNPDCCTKVRHLNGKPWDCSVENLEWREDTARAGGTAEMSPDYGAFYGTTADTRAQRLYSEKWRTEQGLESGPLDETAENCPTEVRIPDTYGLPVTIVKRNPWNGAEYSCSVAREVYDAIREHVINTERDRIRGDLEKEIRDREIDSIYRTVRGRLTRENVRSLADDNTLVFVPKDMSVISRPAEIEKAMLHRLASICALSIDDPALFDGFLKKFAEKLMHTQIKSIVLDEGPAYATLERRIAVVEKRMTKEAVLERRNFLREEKEQMKTELENIRRDREKGIVRECVGTASKRMEYWQSHWKKHGFDEDGDGNVIAPERKSGKDAGEAGADAANAETVQDNVREPVQENPEKQEAQEKKHALPKSAMEIPLATYESYGVVGEAIRTVKRTPKNTLQGVDADISKMYKESYAASRGSYRKKPVQMDSETARQWIENPDAVIEQAIVSMGPDSKYANPLMAVPDMVKVRRRMHDPERRHSEMRENIGNAETNSEKLGRGLFADPGKRGRKAVIATLPDGTEKKFGSMKDAAEFTGCQASEVSRCCRGLKGSVFGLQFRFADPKDMSAVLAQYARAADKLGLPIVDGEKEENNTENEDAEKDGK